MGLREDIKAVKRKPTLHAVEVPEWENKTVYMRMMTMKELLNLSAEIKKVEGGDINHLDSMVTVLSEVICDESGKPLFSEPEDHEWLKDHEMPFLVKMYNKFFSFAQAVKDAEKN